MSEQSIEQLRLIQARLVADTATVTTRSDWLRLQMYWNDIQTVLDNEANGE